jgi:hypothetical protein
MERTPAGNVEMAVPREVIDQLVYELCSLTDEEIRIVEEATKVSVGSQRPHLVILSCNDGIINLWASTILRDDRNRVDTCHSSTYYIAGLRDNHC